MAKVMTTKGTDEEKSLLPWMPYIFGFIFLMGVAGFVVLFTNNEATATEAQVAAQAPAEQTVRSVKSVLEDIRAKRFKEAYNRGSSDFKVSMPYEAFQRFLQPYDALQEWDNVTFSTPQVSSQMAALVAYLHFAEEKETLPISFTLMNEDGQWKIYGFIISREDLEVPLAQMEQLQDLIKVVNLELAYLGKENTMAAYYKLASKQYQTDHTYEQFVEWVQGSPIFTDQEGATLFDGAVNGDTGTLKVSLYSEEETTPIQFKLVKEEGKWKVDTIQFLTAPTVQRPMQKPELDYTLEQVNLFLNNLRDKNIEKAYNLFTSEGFQKSTSLALFETFVQDHPILQEPIRPEFVEGGVEGLERILYLFYPNHPYTTSFEVKLIEEEGNWKIQAISLENPPGLNTGDTIDKGEAIDMVQKVLDLIGSGSLNTFYQQATSRGFKQSTSLEDFQNYLAKHPVLKNHPKVFIQELAQDRDQLFLETDLMDDTHTYSALFVFVYEQGTWKVLKMETKADKRLPYALAAPIVNLSHVLVGQSVNDDGMVQDSGQTLTGEHEPIYVNIFLTANSPEGKVDLYLTHDDSGSQTFPVSGMVDSEGNNILTFSFTPPEEGWPEGKYKATARSQSHQYLETAFEVQPSQGM